MCVLRTGPIDVYKSVRQDLYKNCVWNRPTARNWNFHIARSRSSLCPTRTEPIEPAVLFFHDGHSDTKTGPSWNRRVLLNTATETSTPNHTIFVDFMQWSFRYNHTTFLELSTCVCQLQHQASQQSRDSYTFSTWYRTDCCSFHLRMRTLQRQTLPCSTTRQLQIFRVQFHSTSKWSSEWHLAGGTRRPVLSDQDAQQQQQHETRTPMRRQTGRP